MKGIIKEGIEAVMKSITKEIKEAIMEGITKEMKEVIMKKIINPQQYTLLVRAIAFALLVSHLEFFDTVILCALMLHNSREGVSDTLSHAQRLCPKIKKNSIC